MEEQKQAIIHRAVTRGLDPNVRLKPSGVEWLGDVPEHWEVRRLGRIANVFNGTTPSRVNGGVLGGRVGPVVVERQGQRLCDREPFGAGD